MLVNLPANWQSMRDPVTAILAGPGYVPVHVAKGVYETHFNFEYDISPHIVSRYPFSDALGDRPLKERMDAVVNGPQDFGVCDTWQQILDRWPQIDADPDHEYIISITRLRRDEQPKSGGWRWHKWGSYIGVHDPQHEYLYDETDIDEVQVFHIFEVRV